MRRTDFWEILLIGALLAASLSGEVEGFYPSALVEDGSLVWPAVPENNQAPPMYCKKTLSGAASEEFEFKSLGAMLQLVLTTARENTVLKSLSLTDGEKAMSGAFEVIDGKAVITSKDKAGISLNFFGGLPLGISPQSNITQCTVSCCPPVLFPQYGQTTTLPFRADLLSKRTADKSVSQAVTCRQNMTALHTIGT